MCIRDRDQTLYKWYLITYKVLNLCNHSDTIACVLYELLVKFGIDDRGFPNPRSRFHKFQSVSYTHLNLHRKQLILVDHNERTQAVDGLEPVSYTHLKSFYPDGRSEERTASQEITPMVYDEYAAYVLRDNCVARLDWQTCLLYTSRCV